MFDFVSKLFDLALFLFSRTDNLIVIYCAGLIFFSFSFALFRRLMRC